MVNKLTGNLRASLRSSSNLAVALALALSGLMPIILTAQSSAAQLTSRSVAISTSQAAAANTNYTFTFTTSAAQEIESMIFQFCNTPLGTCVLPGEAVPTVNNGTSDGTEIDVSGVTANAGAWVGTTNTDPFAEVTSDTNLCNDADGGSQVATMFCVERTEAINESQGSKIFTITGITNPTIPSGNNEEVYVRITTFSDSDFDSADIVDEGTVAAAIVNQLTVSGRIQERLIFCVYALNDTAGSNATVGTGVGELPTDCTAAETGTTNVDIGVIDNTSIAYSPEDNAPPSSMGNDRFGAMTVNTNASSGVTIAYYASQGSGTNEQRAFRVSGATCDVSGTSLVDQCFISANPASEAFTAGTERFGMQLACVVNNATAGATLGTTSNLGKTAGTYTFNDGTGGTINTAYDAGRTVSFDDVSDDCENDPSGTTLSDEFAWNDSGTAEALISSDTVVDDEMVKLRFGATASATTPTGNYTVASTYIATPVFQTF